ncbi:2-dehydropantoate 2-reductase [Glaciecola petra]|uniref:2-dehydropantoate 2-reductase n=1 Tax=Glaciecola petra TaxID=3075602 RepID=A0ABU2ZPI1_9ALTE|nr:2-dehydropantoate 2-reductase [Aestuariibacter sp. P117]MDT0594176.1 2-dehydropantoate 2-reductase [Aestuariibacter sp. P117]
MITGQPNDMPISKLTQNNSIDVSAEHVILGAGLIGCYLGAAFIHASQKVTLIAREKFADQLNNNYSISDYEGNNLVIDSLPKIVSPEDANVLSPPADFLWLTIKCLALESAIKVIKRCVGPNTIIVCCQNGVENHKVIQQAFPDHRVIRAMVPFNVINDEVGHFHRGSEGDFVIEHIDTIGDEVKWLSRQLDSAFLPTQITYDMTALQWAKLQLNLGNAVNALANVPVKTMLTNRLYRKLLAKLMIELLFIVNKKKIKLPKIANLPNKWIPFVLVLPDFLFERVAHKMLEIDPKVRTSMWWDLQQKKLTEIDYLNGLVVSHSKALGGESVFNDYVVKQVKRRERGIDIDSEQILAEITELLK